MNIWETISNIGFEVLIHSNHIVQAMFYVGKWNLDITSKPEYATSQKLFFLPEVPPFCTYGSVHTSKRTQRQTWHGENQKASKNHSNYVKGEVCVPSKSFLYIASWLCK